MLRCLEKGFLGSWHQGTVTRCQKQKRHVRYDYIVEDNEVKYLTEVVNVSSVLDGVGSSNALGCSYERDWTCNVRDLWRQPIMEIVSHYYTLTVGEILPAFKLPSDFSEGTQAPDANCDANRGNNIVCPDTGTSDLPKENGDSSNLMDTDQNCGCTLIIPVEEKDGTNALVDEAIEKVKDTMLHDEPVLRESRQRTRLVLSCYEDASDFNGKVIKRRRSASSIIWKRLVLSEVEYCPDVIDEYALGHKSKKVRELLKTKVRKHLAYLGWTIEWTKNKGLHEQRRFRYKGNGCSLSFLRSLRGLPMLQSR